MGGGEAETESFSGGEFSNGGVSNAESIVLETSSSFGSTASSASSTNSSSIKAQVEDGLGGTNVLDCMVALPSSDSLTRYTFIL
jgi:hypothetical protein